MKNSENEEKETTEYTMKNEKNEVNKANKESEENGVKAEKKENILNEDNGKYDRKKNVCFHDFHAKDNIRFPRNHFNVMKSSKTQKSNTRNLSELYEFRNLSLSKKGILYSGFTNCTGTNISNWNNHMYYKNRKNNTRKKENSYWKNSNNEIIKYIKENIKDLKKMRYTLFLKAYEKSELYHMKKQSQKKNDLNEYYKYIEIEDDKERQRLKILKLLKSYHIKCESYTNLNCLCDYSIYYEDKKVKEDLLKKQNCSNFIYYLANIGISDNDIINLANAFENMDYLKDCNLYILPWVNRKLNEFYNFNIGTFITLCVAYSVATLNSSICLFIKYKTAAVFIPLFCSYVILSAPFVFQEIASGCLILDGYFSFFWSLSYYNLPLAVIIFISTLFSLVKYIDSTCLHLQYFSYFLQGYNPWVFKNVDMKVCSKFNESKNICNFSKNICYYDENTHTCKINELKFAIKMYEKRLSNYESRASVQSILMGVICAFSLFFFFQILTNLKYLNKIIKFCLLFIILFFLFYIFVINDYNFIRYLISNTSFYKICTVLLNHEIWISCMIHCIINLSLYGGIYFYTSKGLKLGVNLLSVTYKIIMYCFAVDILMSVAYANIISKFIRNLDEEYELLYKLIRKDVHLILIPLANNYLTKFTKYLSLSVTVLFISLISLGVIKRMEILFVSLKDIYYKSHAYKLAYIWFLLFVTYFIYRIIGINFRVDFTVYISNILILVVLLFVNLNLFWIDGLKQKNNPEGRKSLIIKNILTFLNEFILIYYQIINKSINWVLFYFVRQFINIAIIPVVAMAISTKMFYQKKQFSFCQLMSKALSLTIETVDKTTKVHLQFFPKSQSTNYLKYFLILHLKYFGMDLVIMCFLHTLSICFTGSYLYMKKKYLITKFNLEVLIIMYSAFIYIVYIHIPLLQLIKKKKFLRTNYFNVLDFPTLHEMKTNDTKMPIFGEFYRN